jgi:hypothetical protein
MTFDQWIQYGISQGWCGPALCAIHDGIPTTAEEDDDGDSCLQIIRLYEDESVREAVEENHPLTIWRKGML